MIIRLFADNLKDFYEENDAKDIFTRSACVRVIQPA